VHLCLKVALSVKYVIVQTVPTSLCLLIEVFLLLCWWWVFYVSLWCLWFVTVFV